MSSHTERTAPVQVWDDEERPRQSTKHRLLIGVGLSAAVVLAVAALAVVAWPRLTTYTGEAVSWVAKFAASQSASVAPSLGPVGAVDQTNGHPRSGSADDEGVGASRGPSVFPQQPVLPPPAALSELRDPALVQNAGPGVPSSIPAQSDLASPQAREQAGAPAATAAVSPIPSAGELPSGTPIRLQIAYASTGPAAASAAAILLDRLKAAHLDVGRAVSMAVPVTEDAVVYFFPDDRQAAERVAARLTRIRKRLEPIKLAHPETLPPPGTVEIRIASH